MELPDHEVHVWFACLDQPDWCVRRLAETLSASETERAEGFRFPHHRARFVAGRGLLRVLLGRYLHLEPRELRFTYGSKGKPALDEVHGTNMLHFNLSHSNQFALYAMTRVAEIGIDLECVRPLEHWESISAGCFSRRECQALSVLPDRLKMEGFFNCWTRKEAFIKATGQGLSRPLDGFDVTLAPGEPARFLRISDDSDGSRCWRLQELNPVTGYVGALAMRARHWRLVSREWRGCAQE